MKVVTIPECTSERELFKSLDWFAPECTSERELFKSLDWFAVVGPSGDIMACAYSRYLCDKILPMLGDGYKVERVEAFR